MAFGKLGARGGFGGLGSLGGANAYTAEAQALFARATSSLSAAEKTAINTRILRYKACGAWTVLDALYGFKTQGVASLNWKQNAYNITLNSTISYTANQGYQNAGGYLSNGYTPSTAGGNFALNAAMFGVWVSGHATGAAIFHMGSNDTTGRVLIQTTASDQVQSFINQGATTNLISSGWAVTDGQIIVERTASGAIQQTLNGTSKLAGTTVSTNLPVWPTYIGARNNVNSINGQSNDLYSAALIGGVLTDDQIASVYMADLEYLTDIVCPGDSLTASPSTGAGPYPKQLGLLFSPTRTASNQGIGGQTSTQIAARMGAQPITVTVTNNQIPASGGVAVTAKNINVLTNSGTFAGSMVCTIAGVHGLMTTDGSANWTFTRFTAGIVTSCPGGTQCIPDFLQAFRSKLSSLWLGRNGADGGYTVAGDIAACVAVMPNYLVLSILNSANEPSGSGGYNNIAAMNAVSSAAYGMRYLDVHTPLVAAYSAGNPVDVIDHGNDVTPYTLRMGTAGTITTATVNPGDTTFAISVNGTGAGWVILAGTEYILINSSSGLTVTSCTRGYAGTVAGTYAAGQVITVTDPLHLNPTGEGVVAQAVHDKIVALGL
jgi:hypothetical protein